MAKQVNEQYPVALLHYIICDAKRSIVVEYMADGMHVHHNDVDVLANQPTYDWHHEHLRSYLNLSSEFKPQVKWGNVEYTIYTGGFSSATNTYYMSLYEDPAIKPYPMSAVDLDSSTLHTFA